MIRSYFSTYKNKRSIVLENEMIRAEFLPDPGAKLVSLQSKVSGYEFLVQRKGDLYLDQPFGGEYVKGECSGFDDMFPTIDACSYSKEPWKGTEMVDHGEVWSLPWTFEQSENELEFSVLGKNFPYRLTRRVGFTSSRTLCFWYTLQNLSEYDFSFLWAGHFMVNIEEEAMLVLPDECRQAFTVLTNSGGQFGDIRNWPMFTDNTGNTYNAGKCRSPDVKGFEKYYFTNPLSKGWCELRYPDPNKILRVEFSEDTVPFLGILMNENGWDNLYNIFIEPCTVCYDRPDVAEQYQQISMVKSNDIYQWQIKITI